MFGAGHAAAPELKPLDGEERNAMSEPNHLSSTTTVGYVSVEDEGELDTGGVYHQAGEDVWAQILTLHAPYRAYAQMLGRDCAGDSTD